MPQAGRPQGFSRRHRFAARGAFGAVLAGSRTRGALAVVHAVAGVPGRSRLGIALTRRLIPSSVERNRVRRVVREVFRRHALKQAGMDCVVMLRSRPPSGGGASLARELTELFDRVCARAC